MTEGEGDEWAAIRMHAREAHIRWLEAEVKRLRGDRDRLFAARELQQDRATAAESEVEHWKHHAWEAGQGFKRAIEDAVRAGARRRAAEAESARLASVVAKVEALADEWEAALEGADDYFKASEWAACLRANLPNLRAALASVAPDTATSGEADGPEIDWQEALSMQWPGDTTYPFVEDENANITGYGHQDEAAFAAAINAYDENCNGGPIPQEDQWSADSIAHQWVLPDDDERLHPVAEGTPGAIPVTTLWGAR